MGGGRLVVGIGWGDKEQRVSTDRPPTSPDVAVASQMVGRRGGVASVHPGRGPKRREEMAAASRPRSGLVYGVVFIHDKGHFGCFPFFLSSSLVYVSPSALCPWLGFESDKKCRRALHDGVLCFSCRVGGPSYHLTRRGGLNS